MLSYMSKGRQTPNYISDELLQKDQLVWNQKQQLSLKSQKKMEQVLVPEAWEPYL